MNQQIPAERVVGVQISLEAYQTTLQYISSRPYREVAAVMELLKTNKVILREESPVDAPGVEAVQSDTPPAPPAPPAEERSNENG